MAVQRESDFGETYLKMSDDELLRVASQKDSLLPSAKEALQAEMQKRRLDDTAVVNYQSLEQQVARQEIQQATFEKEVRARSRLETFKVLGIFLAAAIATDWLAAEFFSLSSEAIRLLTKMSLSLALALAVLIRTFAGAWLTLKKTIALAVGFSVCLFLWIIYMAVTAATH